MSGVPRALKFNHGLGPNPTSTCMVTLSELTYGPKARWGRGGGWGRVEWGGGYPSSTLA